MKTLLERFLELERHPLKSYRNHFAKLKKSKEEFEIALRFIDEMKDMDKHQRMFFINRLFLDKNEKPKNWLTIVDLLASASIKRGFDE